MNAEIILPILFALLFLKGLYSGSEIALVNADKVKLRHRARQGNKGASKVLKALRRPDEILSTTLIGTNISTVTLTTLGTMLMVETFGKRGDLYALLIFTPLLLILGEIVPKSAMQQVSTRIAPTIIHPLSWTRLILWPLIMVFSFVARLASRLAGGARSPEQGLFITREQLSSIVEMAEQSTQLSAFDKGRIRKVMQFARTTVGEAMQPMAEVHAISRTKNVERAIKVARECGGERIPVYEGSSSNVTGMIVLDAWDMLDPDLKSRDLESIIRKPLFVSPLQTVEELVPQLAARRDRAAIVVDEYGSAVGMVTFEDLISDVVGNVYVGFEDARSNPQRSRFFEEVEPGQYLLDARFPISEVNDLTGARLPIHDFHTVGGLMLGRLRHLPKEGESITEGPLRLTVEEANERTILKVRMENIRR